MCVCTSVYVCGVYHDWELINKTSPFLVTSRAKPLTDKGYCYFQFILRY